MNGVRAKKRKLSLVTVFALIEIIIIFLFGLLISVNLFVSNRTAKKQDETDRGRQLCRVNGEP